MATPIEKPIREKEEAGAGNMMLNIHPLHPFQPSSSRKPNRENRIKNACNSNSHSNIAPSNDKRPLFVQIPEIPSASLVSTLLPVQCLRPSNFFFFRRIFLNSFLRHRILMRHEHKRPVYKVSPEKGKPPPCSFEAERGLSWQTVCGRTHRPTLIWLCRRD